VCISCGCRLVFLVIRFSLWASLLCDSSVDMRFFVSTDGCVCDLDCILDSC
jgi:hypothetical protein